MRNKTIQLELCTDDPEAVAFAAHEGYDRIELCTGIEMGGLTPNIGLIEQCASIQEIKMHVLLRHKPGNFFYDRQDLEIMVKDMQALKAVGAHGIVMGCLKKDQTLNLEFCKIIAKESTRLNLEYSFHRAFDFVSNPIYAMEQLIDLGFSRILTSGGKPNAIKGLNLIKELVKNAGNRIEIMAGSGIDITNVNRLLDSGIHAIHHTAYLPAESTTFGMGTSKVVDFNKIKAISRYFR